MIEEEKKVEPEVKLPQDLTGYHFTIDGSEYRIGKLISDIGREHLYEDMEIAWIHDPCAYDVYTGKPMIGVKSIYILSKFFEFMGKRFVGVEQLYISSRHVSFKTIDIRHDRYFSHCDELFHVQKIGEIKNEK